MSSIIVELDPQTEQRLRAISRDEGGEIGEIAARLLSTAVGTVPSKSESETLEAELLRKINEGWLPEQWQRYHELVRKRCAETLSADEHRELIRLTEEREAAHARRIEYAVALARVRQTTLDVVLADLGITAPGYA